jgi:RNA polymerase sigma-70 factor, ECF subfamily
MDHQSRHNLFSELIARYQSQLYAYIFAVVKNQQDAEDVFQSVCLVLWRKFPSFQPGDNFFSWARQTAKYVLCSFLRHKNRLPSQGQEWLLDAFAETISNAQGEGVEPHLAALRRCRERLSSADEELLQLRYVETLGIHEIADRLQRLQPSVCRSLNRIRRGLLECIQAELARQEHPPGGPHE